MSNPITAEQVADWLEETAQKLKAAAATVRLAQRFIEPSNGEVVPRLPVIKTQSTPSKEDDIIAGMRAHLREKNSGRAAVIGDRIGVTKEQIEAVVSTHPELFVKAEKGWIKLNPNNVDNL